MVLLCKGKGGITWETGAGRPGLHHLTMSHQHVLTLSIHISQILQRLDGSETVWKATRDTSRIYRKVSEGVDLPFGRVWMPAVRPCGGGAE